MECFEENFWLLAKVTSNNFFGRGLQQSWPRHFHTSECSPSLGQVGEDQEEIYYGEERGRNHWKHTFRVVLVWLQKSNPCEHHKTKKLPRGDDMGTLTSNFHQSTNDDELECKEIFIIRWHTIFSHTHNTNVCCWNTYICILVYSLHTWLLLTRCWW